MIDNPYALENILSQPGEGAPPPAENPYALSAIEADRDGAARRHLQAAQQQPPDTAAKAARLAQARGMPYDVTLRNLAEVAQMQAVDDAAGALSGAPLLRAQVARDAQFAHLAADDTAQLAAVEAATADTIGRAARRGVKGVKLTLDFLADQLARAAGADRTETRRILRESGDEYAALGRDEQLGAAVQRATEGGADTWWKMLGALPAEIADSGDALGIVARFAAEQLPGAVLGGGVGTVASAPVRAGVTAGIRDALVAKGVNMSVAGASANASATLLGSIGLNYQEGVSNGLDAEAAAARAWTKSLAEVPSNALAGAAMGLRLGPGVLGNILGQAVAQGAGGGVGAATAAAAVGETADPAEIALEILGEAVSAAPELAVAASETVSGAVRARGAADAAQAHAEDMGRAMAAAGASRLRERAPQAFADFVQAAADADPQAGGVVFVDAAKLGEVFNQEQLAEVLPSAAAQIEDAIRAGGDVAIPVGELLARIPGTEFEAAILDNIRAEPDALTAAEAREAGDAAQTFMQSAVPLAAEAAMADAGARRADAAVRESVMQQLTQAGRFTPEVNEAYAGLVTAFYRTTSAAAGMTPDQMFQAYPLRVQATAPAGMEAFAQLPAPDQLSQPRTPTAADMVAHGRQEDVPLPAAVSYQYARKARGAPDGSPLIPGYGDMPVAVRLRSGAYAVYDGNHRTDAALARGDATLRMHVIDAASYDPESALGFSQGNPAAPRGAFDPSRLTISLLENADLSTFLHESGHFFLEVMSDVATRAPAESPIATDMAALLAKFGVADVAAWRGMTVEQQRPHHEQFAEWFEQYLFEGKAPSEDLRPLFQRFRAWMVNVYKTLTDYLRTHSGGKLDDEVRGVFDRLIAADEEIKTAEAERRMAPLFATAEASGMTPDGWADYRAAGQDAQAGAVERLQTRSLREMRWLSGARSRALKVLQAEAAERRAEVEAEATAEVMAQPAQAARAQLATTPGLAPSRESAEATTAWRKARAAYQAQQEVSARADLTTALGASPSPMQAAGEVRRRRGVWERANPRPVVLPAEPFATAVAEQHGFDSADSLRAALQDAPAAAVAIEALTDQRMLERYGDLADPRAIERAADEAVHSEARARFVAAELRALQEGTRDMQPTGATVRAAGGGRRPQTVNVLARAAKQFAESSVARRRVRDLRPGQHAAAQARNAKLTEQSLAKGDTAAAIASKRDQLLQHEMERAATAARTEVEAGVRYLRRTAESPGLAIEYREQVQKLLERFELRAISLREVDKRKTLQAWVESQRELGVEPELSPDLLAEAQRRSYRDMTVEEFRGLVAGVEQIEHLGRLKNKLLTAKDKRDFEGAREDLVASIAANAAGRVANTREAATGIERIIGAVKKFGAAHIKAATWAFILDGGRAGGAMWERFIRGANAAGDLETARRADASAKVQDILGPWLKAAPARDSTPFGKKTYFPSISRSLTREGVLAMALNTGNDGNMQRLLGGEGWTASQIEPVLATLTRQDWEMVQSLWDYIGSFKAEIAAKSRRVYGVEPEWVTPVARTFTLADGSEMSIAGGYYPIKYDPSASGRAEEFAAAEDAAAMLKGAHNAATTRRSFTKARVDEAVGRPLLYTLDGLYGGINDVIHDLAWHEWLIDTNRLLRSKQVDSAIREAYGPQVVQQLKAWRDDVATGGIALSGEVDRAMGWVRRNVSAAGLGFNVLSALLQPVGLTQSVQRVGAAWIGRGVATYLRNPRRATRDVREASAFMRTRFRTRSLELSEVRDRVQGQTATGAAFTNGTYALMMAMQTVVDVPTWRGAYERAVSEGNDDERAVALADQAVIDSQGNGSVKDLAAIQRGSQTAKLFTVFYSYMNAAANLGYASARTPGGLGKKAADALLLYVVPAMLTYLLKQSLVPGDSGDEPDEELALKLLQEQAGFFAGLFVGVRELAPVAKSLAGGDDAAFGYSGPAGTRPISDAIDLSQQVTQGEVDSGFVRAVVNMSSVLVGLPSAQINRSIKGYQALADGETSNPLALLLGYQGPK